VVMEAAAAGRAVSLILIDIDHFKSFNDRFGHAAGDTALKRICHDITSAVRISDLTFRFGGEEFIVIAEGLTGEQALAIGERIRRKIATGIDPATARITASIGVAAMPEDAVDYDSLFKIADQRLYQAKAAGRNCVIGARVASAENPVRLAHAR